MESKHTKGEWIEKDSSTLMSKRTEIWVDGDIEKTFEIIHNETSIRETIANSKLIAAAPDLLNACQCVDSLYQEIERMVGGDVLEMLNQVRDAIKKATL